MRRERRVKREKNVEGWKLEEADSVTRRDGRRQKYADITRESGGDLKYGCHGDTGGIDDLIIDIKRYY